MTDDLILVRRKSPAMYRTQDELFLLCKPSNGKFILTRAAAQLLGIEDKGGIMFGFNKAAKTAYVTPDDEPDAFMVTRKDEYRFRFASILVRDYFVDTFDLKLDYRSLYVFKIAEQPNKRGFYQITLKA